MTNPPNLTIRSTVEDVEIPWASEDFRLPDAATVPCLAGTFEDGISGILRDDSRIACRRGCVADSPVDSPV